MRCLWQILLMDAFSRLSAARILRTLVVAVFPFVLFSGELLPLEPLLQGMVLILG